jgi:hypothetical protein
MAAAVLLVGCSQPLEPRAGGQAPSVEAKKAKLGNNVYLEVQGDKRRVLIDAYVCLREGQLEQFLTRKRTKEHEAVLAADFDARELAAALIAAGAEQGHPVRYRPKFEAPTGTPIKIYLDYQEKGQRVRVRAQQWVRNVKTGKDLESDWVFAGSFLIPDPLDKTKPPFFAANYGDVICVSNFDTALLDVPFNSSKESDELAFEAHTERIPPLETPVTVILEPAAAKKTK